MKKIEECESCPPGYYCSEAGLNTTSGSCAAGYYCPQRSVSKQEKPCPVGNYCPSHSEQPILCPVGTYQPNQRQVSVDDCLSCTKGKMV